MYNNYTSILFDDYAIVQSTTNIYTLLFVSNVNCTHGVRRSLRIMYFAGGIYIPLVCNEMARG